MAVRESKSNLTNYCNVTGVKADFTNLLTRFVETNTVRFEMFASLWREMKMPMIFAGRQSDIEVRELTEDIIHIAKQFILPANGFQVQIGGLYLLYALYAKQLCEPKVKIRLTSEEWQILQKLITEIRAQKHYDIEYIYWKLCFNNAFQFVVSALFDTGILRNQSDVQKEKQSGETTTADIIQSRSLVYDLVDGETIDQLSAIQDQYHRVKCLLAGRNAKEPQASLNMIETNLVQHITKKITQFEVWKKTRAGRRVGRRRHDSGPTTSESEGESETDKPYTPKSPKKSRNIGSVRADIKAKAMLASTVKRSRRHRQIHQESQSEDQTDTPPNKRRKRKTRDGSDVEIDDSLQTDSHGLDTTLESEGGVFSMPMLKHLEEKPLSKKKKGQRKKKDTESTSRKGRKKSKPTDSSDSKVDENSPKKGKKRTRKTKTSDDTKTSDQIELPEEIKSSPEVKPVISDIQETAEKTPSGNRRKKGKSVKKKT